MKQFDRSHIMTRAWEIYRKNNGTISFAESLHRSWNAAKAAPVNEARIQAAKAAAGITEETDSWYGWKLRGFEVIHESKCLFQCVINTPAKGDGKTFRQSFFGKSQVAPIPA